MKELHYLCSVFSWTNGISVSKNKVFLQDVTWQEKIHEYLEKKG